MSETFVTLDRRADGIAVVRLDRPKVNALSRALLEQLGDIAEELRDNPPGAVILWGGERFFAAGAEIKEFSGPEQAEEIGAVFRRAIDALAAIPRATIAAIAGFALGGGCEIAMACDFRMVAESAKLGQPEVLLGIIPGAGGTVRLARIVGDARAKELCMSGRQVDAEEALRIGLADRVVPVGNLFDRAVEWAGQFARGALLAQAAAKRAIDQGASLSLAEALDIEAREFVEVFRTDDSKIGIESFLANGPGKANFTGR